MKSCTSIARHLVIVGALTSFAGVCATAAVPGGATPSARAEYEARYARLDPSAVLGGHDGLMPPRERDRPDRWQTEPRGRRSEEERREGDQRRRRSGRDSQRDS